MQCEYCKGPLLGKQRRFCSDRCRMAAKREADREPEQRTRTNETRTANPNSYELVEGEQVYGRQAVRYGLHEAWDLRPQPDSPEDRPKPSNRGVYIRPDGTEYIIDATGRTHERDLAALTANRQLLDDWADGKGNECQRMLGRLSAWYDVIKGYRPQPRQRLCSGWVR